MGHLPFYLIHRSSQKAGASFPGLLPHLEHDNWALFAESSEHILVDGNGNAENNSRSSTRKYMVSC